MASVSNSVVAPLVRGKVFRVTLTDLCGVPQTALSSYVTDGMVTVTSTKNMDMGDEIKLRQANGIIGVYEPGQVSLLNFSVGIQMTKVDPGVIAMLTGDTAILNSASTPLTAGFEERAKHLITANFALEVWTDTSAAACAAGSKQYGYMLYPMLGQAYVTFEDITDKEVTCSIAALSYGSQGWGRGPYGSGTGNSRTVADGVTTAASIVFTSATAAFTSADVGKPISDSLGTKIAPGATIASVTNATTINMSVASLAAGTVETVTIGTNDGSSISGPVNTSSTGLLVPGRLLVAADPTAHRHFEITPIAPPAAQTVTGPQTITLPSPY